jgi:CheY-like chemotaxis protein
VERAKILVVGYELTLLATRASILNRINLHVATACSVDDALSRLAQDHYDLLFLCHTVNEQNARKLLNQVNFSFPSLKVVRLHIGAVPKGVLPIVDADVLMDYQPLSWVKVLDALLAEAA